MPARGETGLVSCLFEFALDRQLDAFVLLRGQCNRLDRSVHGMARWS
jgi:hypothetical protein